MSLVLTPFAYLTGPITGGIVGFVEVPIPTPPNLAGVPGIVGAFVGFTAVVATPAGFDLLAALGP